MKLLDLINHSRYGMFVSFSEAIQASCEATLTRSAILGSTWVIEAAHMPYHDRFAFGHFVR